MNKLNTMWNMNNGSVLKAVIIFLTAQSLPLHAMAAGIAPAKAPFTSTTSNQATSATTGKNLNLSSTSATVPASKSGTIMVGGSIGSNGLVKGGTMLQVAVNRLLTPAMNAALWQQISGGGQHLLLNSSGVAIGGVAKLNSSWAGNLASLVMPASVTVDVIGFNQAHPLSVAGASQVLGALFALQTSAGQTSTLNFGNDLSIGSAGSISALMPTNQSLSGFYASRSLNLNVSRNFNNNGSISVPDTLTLNVGGSLTNAATSANTGATISAQTINIISGSGTITNSGVIQAVSFLNLNTQSPTTNLMINNTGGMLQALGGTNAFTGSRDSGAINFRGTGAGLESANVYIQGGTLSAPGGVNIFGRNMNALVNSINGPVNTTGSAASIAVTAGNLVLGTQTLSGDPAYYNNAGDITIKTNLNVAGDIAIVASGNIITNPGVSITTQNPDDSVFLGAGLNFTIGSGTNQTVINQALAAGDTTNTLTFTGTTNAGMNINSAGNALNIATSGSGSINVVATGDVRFGTGTVSTSAGNIAVIEGTSFRGGTISSDSGNISVSSATPQILSGSTFTSGTLSALPTAAALTNGFITINRSMTSNSGAITLSSNGAINNTGTISSGGVLSINENGGTFTNTGTISSTAGVANDIAIQSNGSLTLAGIGNIDASNGAGSILISPASGGTVYLASSMVQTITGNKDLAITPSSPGGLQVNVSGAAGTAQFVGTGNYTLSSSGAGNGVTFGAAANPSTLSFGGNTVVAGDSAGIIQVGSGVTVFASAGSMTLDAGMIFNNGNVQSGAAGGVVTVRNSSGDLLIAGSGKFQDTQDAVGNQIIIRAGANGTGAITLLGNTTFDPGALTSAPDAVSFQGSQISIQAGSTQTINNNANVTFQPGAASGLTMFLSGASGNVGTFSGTGNYTLASSGAGNGVTIVNTAATNTLSLGGNINVVADPSGTIQVNNGAVLLASSGSVLMDAGTINNNGKVQSGSTNGSITLQNSSGDLLLSGNGFYQDTQNASGNQIIVKTGSAGTGSITLSGSNTFDVGNLTTAANALAFQARMINVTTGTTQTIGNNANVTFQPGSSSSLLMNLTGTSAGNGVFSGTGNYTLASVGYGNGITFGAAASPSTLSFGGNTVVTADSVGVIQVRPGVTVLASAGSMTMDGGIIYNSGNVQSGAAGGIITVCNSSGDLLVGGGGNFQDTQNAVGNQIIIRAGASGTGAITVLGNNTFAPGSAGSSPALTSNAVSFQGSLINIQAGTTQTINNNANVIFQPGAASGLTISLTGASGNVGTFSGTGNYTLASAGRGNGVTITTSSANTLSLGGNVNVVGDPTGTIQVNNGVALLAGSGSVLLDACTINNYGKVQSGIANGSITLQNSGGDLLLNGNGFYQVTQNASGNQIIVNSGSGGTGGITVSGSNTFDVGNLTTAANAVEFQARIITVTTGTTQTIANNANVTFQPGSSSRLVMNLVGSSSANAVFSGSGNYTLASVGYGNGVTFSSTAPTPSTICFQGNTNVIADSAGVIQVGSGVTVLSANGSLLMNAGIIYNSGSVRSGASGGSITLQNGTGNLMVAGGGTFQDASNSAENRIMVSAGGGSASISLLGNNTFDVGTSANTAAVQFLGSQVSVLSGTQTIKSATTVAYQPICFVELVPGTTPLSLKSSKTSTAFIETAGDSRVFTDDSNDSIVLEQGEILVNATEDTSVKIGEYIIQLSKGTVVLLSREGEVNQVRNLHESSRGSISVGKGKIQKVLNAGEELTVAPLADSSSGNVKVAKRKVECNELDGERVVHAEFSFVTAAQNSNVLRQLMQSGDKENCQLAKKLLKTAVCLTQVTAGHGSFAQGR